MSGLELKPVNTGKTPTIRAEWRGWFGRKDAWFWWNVAYQVKANRVRHKDREKVLRVCELVDKAVPRSENGW